MLEIIPIPQAPQHRGAWQALFQGYGDFYKRPMTVQTFDTVSRSRCAVALSMAQIGLKPLCRRLTAMSSAMADSSSTTSTEGMCLM